MEALIMLLMFKVRNYTSFKDESVLDLRATTFVQHPSHVISYDGKKGLLKTTAIYGPNASGKSNFISAMFFFEQYILSQFIDIKENGSFDSIDNKSKIMLEPFSLSDKTDEASEFDIIFIRNGKQIQYGFECTAKAVLNEWLFINEKKVFERSGTKLSFGDKYKKSLNAYNKIPVERLYIAVLEYFLENDLKELILGDFISFFVEEYNVFTEILFESTVKGLAGSIGISKKLVDNKTFRRKVEHCLRFADIGIKRLDIKSEILINEHTGKKKKERIVRTVHDVYDKDGNVVGEKFFNLHQESTGTLRFLAYIQSVIEMINKGGFFIVDEMSA